MTMQLSEEVKLPPPKASLSFSTSKAMASFGFIGSFGKHHWFERERLEGLYHGGFRNLGKMATLSIAAYLYIQAQKNDSQFASSLKNGRNCGRELK
jgi:hypothetical protein